MGRRRASPFRYALVNIWMAVCVLATASCAVLVAQLFLRAPPLDTDVLSIRVALAVPATLGCLAGLYGIVATALLAAGNAKAARLERRLDRLRRRAEDLESRHLDQRARIDELATLREVATIVNRESDFAIIAEKLLELLHGLLEPAEVVIFLTTEAPPKLKPFAAYAAGKALAQVKVARRKAPEFDLVEFESHGVVTRVQGGKLHVLLPLKVQEEVHGALMLVLPRSRRSPARQVAAFNRTRRPILMEIAHHMSLAVKTKYLQTRAVMDGLTHLYSRSHFNAQLQAAIELAQRTQEPFALVLADIDHFKKVNDTYGHTTGDVVLTRVASRIRGVLRKYDSAYRYGGEELAVLLPRTRLPQAAATAERLRAAIEKKRFRGAGGDLIRVTVSIGVAQFERGDGAESVVNRADQRLYRAKRQGRNRVVAAV